jgi:PAS domain S-box-containing protein
MGAQLSMNLAAQDLARTPRARYQAGRGRICAATLRLACLLALLLVCFNATTLAAVGSLSLFTNAQQVIDLGMEGARLNPHPVKLRGVLTYVAVTHKNWIFVQDDTAGVLVTYEKFEGLDPNPTAGQLVEVDGVVGVGAFHTFVTEASVKVVGGAPFPNPRRTPIDKLMRGADFGQWTRLQCTVRDAGVEEDRLVFQVQSDGHPFYVWVRRPSGWPLPPDWIDAELEVDGVVWTVTDPYNRPYSIRLHVPDIRHVRQLRPGSTNTFDKQLVTARSLRRISRNQDRSVRILGTVTFVDATAAYAYVRDQTGPIRCNLLQPIFKDHPFLHGLRGGTNAETVKKLPSQPLRVGDIVEMVGAPTPGAPYVPVLHGGEYRLLGHTNPPPTRILTGSEAPRPQDDGELVRLRARLVERDQTPSGRSSVTRLWLEADGRIFEARMTLDTPSALELPENGFLEITGICNSIVTDWRKPHGLRILIRDENDIRVLHEPEAWLGAKAARVLLGTGIALIVVLAWGVMLRRQVNERTAELRAANRALEQKVAEHQSSQAALGESEARYRTLTEHAPETIVVFDVVSGKFETFNENAKRLFGLDAEALPRCGLADVSPDFQPDGRRSATALADWINRATTGEAQMFEWVHRHASGRLVPCEVRLVRLSADGRVLLRGTVIDNSERRRRELVQRATYQISEAVHAVDDLRSLYQRIHAIVKGLMPADNFFLLLHDPATDLHYYAYHIDQMDAWPAPRKVTGGLVGHILRTSKALLVDQESMMDERHEWHYVSGTPSAIWLGVPLVVRGKTIGVMAVQDYQNPQAYGEEEKQILTYVAAQTALAIDRKRADAALTESEARTRLIVDNALDAVITMDAGGVIRGWNSQAEQTFGWTTEEAVGQSLASLIVPPNMRDAHFRGLKTFIATGEGAVLNKRIEVNALHRDGHEFPVELAIAPLRLGNSWIFSGFARDISERKKAEEDMQRALVREKELGALKSSFVSLVSHEFRTPLGVIMSASEILDRYFDRLPPDKRRKHLDMVFRATKNLAELMEGVLLLGKVEQGRMQFTPAPFDCAGFCRELVEEIRSATARRCPIELTIAPDVPEGMGDVTLLRHILTNVLSNAVKYSEPGRAVEFRVERRGADALLTVRDHGIGIPEEDRENLFRSFARGRNVGSIPGTGLGLLIVKRCVDLHGGQIEINSRPGEGTTVLVTLPLFAENVIGQPLET